MKEQRNNIKIYILLVALLVIILGIFIFFIVSYIKMDKNRYEIEQDSVLYTEALQYIKIEGNAYLEEKIDGKYYLFETKDGETKKYKLGKNAVVYKTGDAYVYIYGDAYQVLNSGAIEKISGKSTVSRTSPTKMFKLDDRKYLMVDSNIKSKNDDIVNANSYLYIEIDKNGNAAFTNNDISFKTINPIILSGSFYDFDIANEILKYDKNEFDLANIIGSTNQYRQNKMALIVDSTDKKEKNETTSSGSGGGTTAGNGTKKQETITQMDVDYYDDYMNSIITSVNNLAVSLKNANEVSSKLISRKQIYYDFNKWLALRGVTSTSSTITVSYSIFDPNSEYDTVFVTLAKQNGEEKTYSVNKNNNSYLIRDLTPNTKYTLSFGYKANNSNTPVINDEVAITTKKADYSLQITKLKNRGSLESNDTVIELYYTLKVDKNYKFRKADIVFTSDGNELYRETLKNQKSNDITGSLITDKIDSNNNYNGVMTLPVNTALGSENIISLDNIEICESEDMTSCSLTSSLDVKYKFYNE